MTRLAPDFTSLDPASVRASRAAQGASRKRDTKPEILLRRELHARGLRFRVDRRDLPGRPDIVFGPTKVVVFVDGDFWHGKNLEERIARLEAGHNAPYWVAKILGNVERDLRHNVALAQRGWLVLRKWESEIAGGVVVVADEIEGEVRRRR